MIRTETNCGFLNPLQGGWQFWAGNSFADKFYSRLEYTELYNQSLNCPVPVLYINTKPKWYWWFREQFYSVTEEYTAEEMAYLISDKLRKKQKQIDKAIAQVTAAQVGNQNVSNSRNILHEVKTAVWRRDQGRCTRCGSNQNLEYDHIIPFSLGGSNTERNIQLLCEICNRAKGVGF